MPQLLVKPPIQHNRAGDRHSIGYRCRGMPVLKHLNFAYLAVFVIRFPSSHAEARNAQEMVTISSYNFELKSRLDR